VNLGIPEDKISMILGPSGTGKSVCIKHMVGLLYPDQGDVLVHGGIAARRLEATPLSERDPCPHLRLVGGHRGGQR